MRLWLLASGLLLLAALPAGAGPFQDYQGGLAAQRRGDFRGAQSHWDRLLSRPQLMKPRARSQVYSLRGVCQLNFKQPSKALGDFYRAIAADRGFYLPYALRGKVWLMRRQYDWALWDFNKSLSLRPHFAFAFYNRGLALALKGRYRLAAADLKACLRLVPKHHSAGKVLAAVEKKLAARPSEQRPPSMVPQPRERARQPLPPVHVMQGRQPLPPAHWLQPYRQQPPQVVPAALSPGTFNPLPR